MWNDKHNFADLHIQTKLCGAGLMVTFDLARIGIEAMRAIRRNYEVRDRLISSENIYVCGEGLVCICGNLILILLWMIYTLEDDFVTF